jgi:hypothetical protein
VSFYVEFSFSAQIALLESFLDRSRHIVDEIENHVLNVQGKRGFPIGNRHHIEQILSSCFFESAPRDLARLREQLSTAHRADGFEPVQQEGGAHDFNPAQLTALAHSYWTSSRWPGRNGRMAYAQTIYSVFVVNQLEQLSLRMWDEGDAPATARLQEIQRLLDRRNEPSGSNLFVRTAPWLLQIAQGPLTRLLQPYFDIAEHILNRSKTRNGCRSTAPAHSSRVATCDRSFDIGRRSHSAQLTTRRSCRSLAIPTRWMLRC